MAICPALQFGERSLVITEPAIIVFYSPETAPVLVVNGFTNFDILGLAGKNVVYTEHVSFHFLSPVVLIWGCVNDWIRRRATGTEPEGTPTRKKARITLKGIHAIRLIFPLAALTNKTVAA